MNIESSTLAKALFDPDIVGSSWGGGCFSNPPSADQSNWGEALRDMNDLLDRPVVSDEVPCVGFLVDAVVRNTTKER